MLPGGRASAGFVCDPTAYILLEVKGRICYTNLLYMLSIAVAEHCELQPPHHSSLRLEVEVLPELLLPVPLDRGRHALDAQAVAVPFPCAGPSSH